MGLYLKFLEEPSPSSIWARWAACRPERKEAKDKLRVQYLTIRQRGNIVIKIGDLFKDIESGKMFIVKSVDPKIIILGSKDGTHSMFVNPNDIESMFLPFIEDEGKKQTR